MTQLPRISILTGVMLVLAAAPAVADDRSVPAGLNTGNVAWMLVSSALVLMMTAPGLALFYCGLVRKKNVLSVMMQCVFLMGLLSVLWAVYGYSLSFGDDVAGGIIGNHKYVLLLNVAPLTASEDPILASYGIPRLLHMVFQMMFFIITPALVCGAFAERMKFSAMVVFTVAWATLVYCPLAHWVWSDTGWLNAFNTQTRVGALDFAGGAVVHISSGVSALMCAFVLGRRLGYGQQPMPPHNLTYTCVGAAMLWVGWFGFNAGSALGATAQAVNAFVATHLAAAAGTLAWAGAEWITRGKPSILGACSGAVAGLVVITPACGFVLPQWGLVMGLAAGLVCFYACNLKSRFGYDDALDAFGVHGVGGILGALLTGVFATREVIPGITEAQGLLEGNASQLVNQIIAVLATVVLSAVMTLVILRVIDVSMGLRVSQHDELQGLDVSQHGEDGYIFL